ncbi:MAG: hypothetical protein KDB26_00925 [Microthrixaceae bacterium]|nr:hypothetical protein [Microthrixaceae bacterium]
MKVTTLAVALVAVAAIGAGCAVPPPPAPPAGHDVRYITRDGADTYKFVPSGNSMVVTASASNGGANSRTLVWNTADTGSLDHQTCVTFTSGVWPTQEGVALRVSAEGHPGKAITVMKNVFAFAIQHFNVQLVDLSKPKGQVLFAPIPASDFGPVLGSASGPWRLCASVVGNELSFKVWPESGIEPSWNDELRTRKMILPPEWVYAGHTGLYAGHLPAGSVLRFSNIQSEYY